MVLERLALGSPSDDQRRLEELRRHTKLMSHDNLPTPGRQATLLFNSDKVRV